MAARDIYRHTAFQAHLLDASTYMTGDDELLSKSDKTVQWLRVVNQRRAPRHPAANQRRAHLPHTYSYDLHECRHVTTVVASRR